MAEPPPDSDTALTVRAALAQLPDEQRVPLMLLDMEGYTVAEIAGLLGVAEGTIKSRCSRGRARLAIMLGNLRPGTNAGDLGDGAAHGNLGQSRDVGTAEGVGRGGGGS